jgi:hypothetical protein
LTGAAIAGSYGGYGGGGYSEVAYSEPAAVSYSSEGGGSYAGGETIVINGTAEPAAQAAEQATQIADNYAPLSSEVATPPATAATGTEVSPDIQAAITEDWMPLGVYGLTDENSTADPTQYVQLLISKSGAVGGELHDLTADTSTPVYGALDPKTQRVAWKVGDTGTVMESGLYNLTQTETPVLVHENGMTIQKSMQRIEDPSLTQQGAAQGPVQTAAPLPAPVQ